MPLPRFLFSCLERSVVPNFYETLQLKEKQEYKYHASLARTLVSKL